MKISQIRQLSSYQFLVKDFSYSLSCQRLKKGKNLKLDWFWQLLEGLKRDFGNSVTHHDGWKFSTEILLLWRRGKREGVQSYWGWTRREGIITSMILGLILNGRLRDSNLISDTIGMKRHNEESNQLSFWSLQKVSTLTISLWGAVTAWIQMAHEISLSARRCNSKQITSSQFLSEIKETVGSIDYQTPTCFKIAGAHIHKRVCSFKCKNVPNFDH